MNTKNIYKSNICQIALLAVGGLGSSFAFGQPIEENSDQPLEEIVITGFRQSLQQALGIKRNETGAVDAIFAEDIADFPDLNLADSLQRIPGVAITREFGEGRQISVRGLSGEFTRVRVNGLEAVATTGNSGPNRERNFDYNIFASELFQSIVVRKTASASVDEGSLGAVVDLNTGNALAYDEGSTFVISARGSSNDFNDEISPRVSGLYAYRSSTGKWGATLSAAYSETDVDRPGSATVRWQTASFASVRGVDCVANPADPDCNTVANAFHPRIPRYGNVSVQQDRLGLTGGIQIQATDDTRITFDALYSDVESVRQENWLQALLRGNEGGMDVVDFVYDASTNNLVSGTLNNTFVRNEHVMVRGESEFHQISGQLDHSFTDSVRLNALLGTSKADSFFPTTMSFFYDDTDYDNFFYDFSNDRAPVIAFRGPDVTDGANFHMRGFRDRVNSVSNSFDTISGSLQWDFTERLTLKGGINHKEFAFSTSEARRDSNVCSAGLFDCDPDGDGIEELQGAPATADRSFVYTYPGNVAGDSNTSYLVADLSAWNAFVGGLENLPANPRLQNNRRVEENNLGVFLELSGNAPLGSADLQFDLGMRYVETDQESTGFNSGQSVTVDRPSYSDTLPSLNAALWMTDDLVLRSAAAEVLARPSLGDLSPGGSVSGFRIEVDFNNPFLDPTRATAYDLGLEWYFAEEAVLGLAYFAKDIESFPLGAVRTGTYASTGLPLSLLEPGSPAEANPEGGPAESCNPANGGQGCWQIEEIQNGPGADLDGFEVLVQFPFTVFDSLPSFWQKFGFTGNYTYVDSNVDYNIGGTIFSERLIELSNRSYNATLYFEGDRFTSRVSVAYRDGYLDGTGGNGNVFGGFRETTNVDLSAKYSLNDRWDLTFEGLNMTDEDSDRWVQFDLERMREFNRTGRAYLLGAKYQF